MDNKTRNQDGRRIVITGRGTVNPIAFNVKEFWENLIKGKSGVRKLQNIDLGDFPVQIGGEIDYPDFSEYFTKKNTIKRLDRFIIFGHVAATQALRDSGLSRSEIDRAPHRYGAIIGTGDGGNGLHYRMFHRIQESGLESVSPFYAVGVIPNIPPAFFSKENNLQGPNFSINSACATGNHSIATAALFIKAGLADVLFSGGTEGVLNEAGYSGFSIINALSRRNDSPETASRPFDKDRDGFVMGEGAGVICLEELDHAKKRGAKIFAELKGFGFSCDAYDLVAPEPDGRGANIAMENALNNAGLNTEDIDLINAHGTSTPLGDIAESKAIRKLFGAHADNIYVHSTKSMIGHLIGAAGGVESIACLQALEEGVIHPSINLFEQDPEIDLKIAANKPVEKKITHVLSNNFGFGGQNATTIFSKFQG
jgi:3-oxoacyl-[acyl-carrier-protein] synthase II